MYLVIARSNGRDANFASISPRFITKDPKHALNEARQVLAKDYYFLDDVIIFRLEEDKTYSADDSFSFENIHAKTIMYILWKEYVNHERAEKFYQDFKKLCEE